MIFVTGPMFSGKQDTICRLLGWSESDFAGRAVRDVQDLAAEAVRSDPGRGMQEVLAALADRLAEHDVVVSSETGAGVVPVDATERLSREAAGRLAVLLAERADCVIRVVCGLPQFLKGQLRRESSGEAQGAGI